MGNRKPLVLTPRDSHEFILSPKRLIAYASEYASSHRVEQRIMGYLQRGKSLAVQLRTVERKAAKARARLDKAQRERNRHRSFAYECDIRDYWEAVEGSLIALMEDYIEVPA